MVCSEHGSLYTGLAHVTLELAAFIVNSNIRMVRTWHEETGLGDPDHYLLQPDDPNYGFMMLTEEQYLKVMGITGDGEIAA